MGDGTLSLYKGESQLETLSQMYMHLAHTIDNQVPAANSNYTYNVTRLWSCSIDPKISWSRSGWQFFFPQIIWTSALSVHDAIPSAPYYLNWSYAGVTLKDDTNREYYIFTEKKIVN